MIGHFDLFSQNCTPIYHKTYNGPGDDEGLDISVTSDKGSIVAGRTTTNSPLWDGLLIRLNEQGDILWSKSYGGSEFDELVKVKQTTDGGYIGLGRTRSFGLTAGEVWLIKTDGDGNLLWSKNYSNGSQPVRPKALIQLTDGSYLFAYNTNDSTVLGDGVIVHTNGAGDVLWSKVFDNGNDDGINSLYQDGNTILVGGYGTVTDREGILMRISVTDGSMVWAKKFARTTGLSDEIIQVEKPPEGLAFGASSTWVKPLSNSSNYYLTLFKTWGDDSIYVQRRIQPHTASGYTTESVQLRSTTDGAFIYLVNDTTPIGWPAFRKMSPAGLVDWGRQNNIGYGQRRLKGFDLFFDQGYMFTGYYKDFFTGNRSRLQVLKTDITGKNGSCTGDITPNFSDTTNYIVGTFSWRNITTGVSSTDLVPAVSILSYTTNTLCLDTYCVNPDPPKATLCYATLLSHIKGNGNYSFTPFDFEKVNDGYVIFGYNRLFWNVEPMMIKVQPDGTVLWAKTLTEWIHAGAFDKVITTDDGNLLVKGHYDVTINHSGWFGAILMKVTPDGKVLWSKDFSGEIYDLKPTKNGGFVGTMTTAYGFPPIYVTLFKMDANGNIVWQKQMNKDYDHSAIYRTIQFDGTYFYVAGEFYNQTPQNIAIEKVDLNGNRVWSKVFKIEGFSTSVAKLDIIGDSLYLSAFYWDNSQVTYMSKKRLAMVKVSKNGGSMNLFKLTDLDLVADGRTYAFMNIQTQIVTKTFDDNFVIAERVSNTTDSSIVLTKFTPTGQILWSKRYDQLKNHFISSIKDDNGSLILLGRKFVGESDQTYQFETLLMRTDNNGQIIENGTGYCHTTTNVVHSGPAKFDEVTWYVPPQTAPGAITSTSFTPLERFFPMNVLAGCSTIGDCYNLEITGLQTICSISDTVVYNLHRNPGCTVIPVWKYDPSVVTVTKQTDSTLSVLFKKGGRTIISATISSGCGIVSDTILISIPSVTFPLNLGNDTTICTGTTIILNAHRGYLSYKWQDGSTDSTFEVKDVGKYFVTAIDSCGTISSDTLLVVAHPPIPFNIGADRIKCNDDTVHIDAPAGFINYTWSPSYNISSVSGQKIVINPSKDTTYFVKAELTSGCFAYDTVSVKVNHSPPINLGNDTSFCFGKSIVLDVGGGFSTYRWSDGSSSQTFSVTKAGTYSVTGTTVEGCSSYDTMKVIAVYPLPVITLDHNQELCESSTRSLDPGVFSSYLWHDGSINRKYTVNTTGTYYVEVTDNNGCSNSDTTRITTILPAPSDFLPSDTSICSYGAADLRPDGSFSSYLWSNGSTLSKTTVDRAGNYWLQVRDSKGCAGRDTIAVTLKDCMKGVYVPTAFTPNQDSKNDEFRAMLFGKVKSFDLTIYNRWGQPVFHTTDHYKGWDGRVAGKEQDPGTFIWLCRYQLEGEREKVERGTVTLIR